MDVTICEDKNEEGGQKEPGHSFGGGASPEYQNNCYVEIPTLHHVYLFPFLLLECGDKYLLLECGVW